MREPRRLVVLAPNWLGDAVMALPLVNDLRRAWPQTRIAIAARPAVAPLFTMVPAIDEVVVLERGGGWDAIRNAGANAGRLADREFDAALLLPNSFLAAWMASRAQIPERWGIARDLRSPLLTRAIARPRSYGHQVEYYQAIGRALQVPAGEPHGGIAVPDAARAGALDLLRAHGVTGRFVVFAPGAAYGRAKQWLPERFAALARLLAARAVSAVLVGAAADRSACAEVTRLAPAANLSGATDLPMLAGVLSHATHVVANDSGAMHLAAAVGARVTAVFGPTNELKTSPLRADAGAPSATIVCEPVWCRPCMLRECPIDHRCMTRISAERVFASIALDAAACSGPR